MCGKYFSYTLYIVSVLLNFNISSDISLANGNTFCLFIVLSSCFPLLSCLCKYLMLSRLTPAIINSGRSLNVASLLRISRYSNMMHLCDESLAIFVHWLNWFSIHIQMVRSREIKWIMLIFPPNKSEFPSSSNSFLYYNLSFPLDLRIRDW